MKGNINFDDIIKNAYVDTYFQPVVDLLKGNVIGYEALSRGPRGTDFYMPNALIAEAKSRSRMGELDFLLRKMALINAAKRDMHKLLFIRFVGCKLHHILVIRQSIHTHWREQNEAIKRTQTRESDIGLTRSKHL